MFYYYYYIVLQTYHSIFWLTNYNILLLLIFYYELIIFSWIKVLFETIVDNDTKNFKVRLAVTVITRISEDLSHYDALHITNV